MFYENPLYYKTPRERKKKERIEYKKKCNDTKRIYVSFKFGITWLLNNT